MAKLSEDYYLRNYYLKTEKVPTQSVMKEKMSPPLANVYFKSMTPKLKVLAGLEPPMKGGGNDWFIPPDDLLKGRTVMKPIKNNFIKKLGFNGIDFFGEKLVHDHHQEMEEEKRRLLHENDLNWKRTVEVSCNRQWDETSREQTKQNTAKIQQAFHEFTTLYTTSITKIESLLFDAAIKEIKRVKEEAFNKMQKQYETLLKQQATMLYDRYEKKILKEKNRQKDQFISTVEKSRTAMGNQLHDINVEKHVAIERLRVLLECQNLACQVYVALKEREECKQVMDLSKHEHEKTIKALSEHITLQDFEIQLAKEKEKKRHDFIAMWQKKVCHVVKKFQDFVKFCLNTLPEHAEFFINMEKLLLLQLSDAMENPSVESIFVPEETTFHTPVPKPHPFFLFCDKGYKPRLDEDLCPKHCTSSASQFPVIIVNKRCIYAACDNFEIFTDKVKQFVEGRRGDDDDFIDDHDYTYNVPVKCTSTDELLQLKLESSLMQILQNEIPNPRNVNLTCCICKSPTCFCECPSRKKFIPSIQKSSDAEATTSVDFGKEIKLRCMELEHEREPKWNSYLQYVLPTQCHCVKRAKKHLEEHLPAYMRNMSRYDVPDLSNYKTCTIDKLKTLVKNAQKRPPALPEPEKVESKTRNIGTQYSDQEFEYLCTCMSDDEIEKIFKNLIKGSKLFDKSYESKFEVVDGSLSPTYLHKEQSSFIRDRTLSLRRLIDDKPELEEIFKKKDCKF